MTDPPFNLVEIPPEQRIFKSIVLPIAAAIVSLLLAVVVGVSWLIDVEDSTQTEHLVQAASNLFRYQMEEETEAIKVGIAGVVGNRAFAAPLRAGDRDELLRLAGPIFETMRRDAKLTHFYFGAADGTTVLRVHAPAAFGDRYDHLLTPMSQRSGAEAEGLELGGLGALSLRVAAPYRDHGQTIGFVELGEEFGHIAGIIHEILGIDLFVLIDKRRLDRARWERGRAMYGWPLPWDQFPAVAVDGATMADPPPLLLRRLAEAPADGAVAEGSVVAGGRILHLAPLPLLDAAGERLGSLVVIADRTTLITGSRLLMGGIAILCLCLAGLLVALLRRVVGGVERRIVRGTTRLARANADLERVAYLACHDLQGPLERVVTSSLHLESACRGLSSDQMGHLRGIAEGARHLEDTVGTLEDYLDLDVNARVTEPVALDAVLAAALEKVGPHMDASDRLEMAPLPTVTGRPVLLARAFFCILDYLARARLPGRPLELSVAAEGRAGAWRIRFSAAPLAPPPAAADLDANLHLAIAHRVAVIHGGGIAVTAEPGDGTVIVLSLGA